MAMDYFYGLEAGQFDFIRVPKLLMTQKEFVSLSTESKVLYGLLLDRMGQARKNKWIDENGKVFVVYPIAEVEKTLRISKRKAMMDMAELENCGLIERRRRGHGLSDMIYVMKIKVIPM